MTRRSFTLVEVVVTIGIIVLLAGLVLSVSVIVVQNSEVRQTEQVIMLLEQAVLEWEATSNRKVSWARASEEGPTPRFDMHDDTPAVFSATELFNTIGRVESVKSIIAQIDPEIIHVYRRTEYPPWLTPNERTAMDTTWAIDNSNLNISLGLAVIDAWGKPILVVHPGRVLNPIAFPSDATELADNDGTLRTPGIIGEYLCGVARNRQIFFVSAGPDGFLGDLGADADTSVFKQTQDNVYSYEPQAP